MSIFEEVYYEYSRYFWTRLEPGPFFGEYGVYQILIPSFVVIEVIGYQTVNEYVFSVNDATDAALMAFDNMKAAVSILPQPIAEEIVKYMDIVDEVTRAVADNIHVEDYGIRFVHLPYGQRWINIESDGPSFDEAP